MNPARAEATGSRSAHKAAAPATKGTSPAMLRIRAQGGGRDVGMVSMGPEEKTIRGARLIPSGAARPAMLAPLYCLRSGPAASTKGKHRSATAKPLRCAWTFPGYPFAIKLLGQSSALESRRSRRTAPGREREVSRLVRVTATCGRPAIRVAVTAMDCRAPLAVRHQTAGVDPEQPNIFSKITAAKRSFKQRGGAVPA